MYNFDLSFFFALYSSRLQVFVNGEVYNVGTVGNYEINNITIIVGIILGIVAALVVGAGLALAVMMYFRKKKQGEEMRKIKSCKF